MWEARRNNEERQNHAWQNREPLGLCTWLAFLGIWDFELPSLRPGQMWCNMASIVQTVAAAAWSWGSTTNSRKCKTVVSTRCANAVR